MEMQFVDLYQHFNAEKPEGREGRLTGWITHTPQRVSLRRLRPAILILPGGGYGHTSPREAEPVALRFAARGYAAFVLNYSCAPAVFPTALREAAMAIRYIRENSAAMEVDPNMVATIGFSAGGHLCGCLGTMYDCPELADIGAPEMLRPDVLGLCYPVAVSWGRTHDGSFENVAGGDEALRRSLSLESRVRKDMPPVFMWHTRDDQSVPCRNSLILAQALEEAGVDFALHVYRRGPHGLSTADLMAYSVANMPEISRDVPGWVDEMAAFFEDCGLKIRDYEVNT